MDTPKHVVTRRDFVKHNTAAAVAVSAFSILPSQTARAAEPIKVGVIGVGGRGKAAAEDAIRAHEGVRITAIADLFPYQIETAKIRLAKSDQHLTDDQCFAGFDAYKEVLASDIDYVILTTPPVFRPMMLEAAVAAGKHVFMEKPAAVDAPGIRRVIAAGEAAKKKGLSIVAGTQRRHEPNYRENIQRIHEGALGEIQFARALWCTGPIAYRKKLPEMSEMEYQIRNWYHYLWLSGDHLVEQHVHNLDIIVWAMQKYPVKAYGVGGRAWQQWGNIWDHHAVDFEFDNGVHLFSLASQFPRPENGSRVNEFIHGTKATTNCQGNIWGETLWNFEGERVRPYIQEHVNLIESIINNKGINEAESCALSTMTAILGRTAEYEGREVTWEEAFNSDQVLCEVPQAFVDWKPVPVPVPGGFEFTGQEGWKADTDE
ncbi:MAG: Gfo/Idh/MocA family oxidoreductase [bacterium]|jgi:predicted dehydrogenase|nr:Gfo/Idh/MocA family oxidoreductase [bacterium]